jgi:hypothetical protein
MNLPGAANHLLKIGRICFAAMKRDFLDAEETASQTLRQR